MQVETSQAVLVVDDNPDIVSLVCECLKKENMPCIPAVGPEIALSRWKESQDHIFLVLTDLQMPEMNGDVLVKQLLTEKPDLKVIFTSGTPWITEQLLEPNVNFFLKPFSFNEVINRIKEMAGS
jgi:CheY-like chemotaxis protein